MLGRLANLSLGKGCGSLGGFFRAKQVYNVQLGIGITKKLTEFANSAHQQFTPLSTINIEMS